MCASLCSGDNKGEVAITEAYLVEIMDFLRCPSTVPKDADEFTTFYATEVNSVPAADVLKVLRKVGEHTSMFKQLSGFAQVVLCRFWGTTPDPVEVLFVTATVSFCTARFSSSGKKSLVASSFIGASSTILSLDGHRSTGTAKSR
jgi:hypothetical protein